MFISEGTCTGIWTGIERFNFSKEHFYSRIFFFSEFISKLLCMKLKNRDKQTSEANNREMLN
jgi:hypothetical protein